VRRGKDADQESQGKPKPGLARLCRLLSRKFTQVVDSS